VNCTKSLTGFSSAAELVARARELTGLEKFYSDSYREGLELATAEYARCKTLTPIGRAFQEQLLVQALSQRLKIDDWLARHPEAAAEPVKEPVFIVGLPRTGTTLLVNLLALDPRRRPFFTWESDNAVPPPEAAHMQDDPRIAQKRAALQEAERNGLMLPHFELAEDPSEEWFLLFEDFKAIAVDHVADVPGYGDWFYHRADMLPALRHHKRALQLLQSRAPGRWLLKHPSHVLHLDALFAIYPDAKAIVLHRDPLLVVAAYCSLLRYSRQLLMGESVDLKQLGAQYLPMLVLHADRLVEYRHAHPRAPFHDLHYHEFKADPLGEIRRIYAFLSEELTPAIEEQMRRYLAVRPEQPFGKHDYTLEEFHLERRRVRELFRRYASTYDVRLG
jgi:hypothetical protein